MKKKKIYDKINHNVQIWETIKIILGRVPYKTDNLNEIINNNTKTLGKSWEKQILKLKKLELTGKTRESKYSLMKFVRISNQAILKWSGGVLTNSKIINLNLLKKSFLKT